MWLDSKAVNCPQKWGNFTVKLTGCRGIKPPYRVFRCGFTTDILGLSHHPATAP